MGFDLGDLKRLGKKVLKKGGAPILGTLLGGPAGSIAGDILGNLFGGDKSAKEIEKLIDTDPAAYAKLREYEMKHKEALQQLEIEEKKMYLVDIQSARTREVEFVKVTGGRDWFHTIVGSLVVAGFMATVVISFKIVPPVGSERLIGILIGTLGAGFIQVLNYLYGSSKGSADKAKTLERIAANGSGK